MHGVFASYFPARRSTTVWTIVNRSDISAWKRVVARERRRRGQKFYDLYHGVELKPRMDGKDAMLSFLDRAKRLWCGFAGWTEVPNAGSREAAEGMAHDDARSR